MDIQLEIDSDGHYCVEIYASEDDVFKIDTTEYNVNSLKNSINSVFCYNLYHDIHLTNSNSTMLINVAAHHFKKHITNEISKSQEKVLKDINVEFSVVRNKIKLHYKIKKLVENKDDVINNLQQSVSLLKLKEE